MLENIKDMKFAKKKEKPEKTGLSVLGDAPQIPAPLKDQ